MRHPLRKRIRAIIQQSPGILAQDLADQLDCKRGTVRHHLARMREAGVIRVVAMRQRSHLFLSSTTPQDRRALSVLQRGRTWDLARQVARNPGQPQRDLTESLHMTRKVLRKYVDRLLERGLIREVDNPPFRTYFPTRSLRSMVDQWDPFDPEEGPDARLRGELGSGRRDRSP